MAPLVNVIHLDEHCSDKRALRKVITQTGVIWQTKFVRREQEWPDISMQQSTNAIIDYNEMNQRINIKLNDGVKI